MQSDDFSSLGISRYELRLRARRDADLPAFLGSTLRGAFGHALKEAVCVMSHRDCARCMLADRCVYPYLFETPVPPDVPQLQGQQQAPHPFILMPPVPGNPVTRVWRAPFPARATATSRVDSSATSPPVAPFPATSRAVAAVAGPDGSDSHSEEQTTLGSAARLGSAEIVGSAVSAQGARKDACAPRGAPRASRVLLPSDRRQRVAAGEELVFGLLLMGRAIDYLPYIVYAVSEMARRGLGADRARFELASVAAVDECGVRTTIYSGESERIAVSGSMTTKVSDLVRTRLDGILEREQAQTEASATTGSLKLRFMTPTRIRVEGDLQTSMSFELLARNLLRRVSLLTAVHGREKLSLDYRGLIADAAGVETRSARLEWDDWERYSNRQQAKMRLGGFVGEVEYTGEAIEGYLPLLVAGEILHVGAATSFGLGKYEILA